MGPTHPVKFGLDARRRIALPGAVALMGGALAASEFRVAQQNAYQQHDQLGSSSEAWTDHPVKHHQKFTCFFTVVLNNRTLGRVTFELRGDVCPRTAENFRCLCTHELGFGFRGSRFHRIVPQLCCQGGDVTAGDGTGGRSCFGEGRVFPDENFRLKHSRGVLSMANRGPNTNCSQFFVCCAPPERCQKELDGRFVVFGRVVGGQRVIDAIERAGGAKGRPTKEFVIGTSGEAAPRETLQASSIARAPAQQPPETPPTGIQRNWKAYV